jgi:hypothetical protein
MPLTYGARGGGERQRPMVLVVDMVGVVEMVEMRPGTCL